MSVLCRFNDASGLLSPPEWEEWTQKGSFLPLVFIQKLLPFTPLLIPLLGYDIELEEALKTAQEISDEPVHATKVFTATECIVKEIGECTGTKAWDGDQIDQRLKSAWAGIDNACKRHWTPYPAITNPAGVALDTALKTSYSFILFDIAACVQSIVESQLIDKQIKVKTGEYRDGTRCVEKRTVRNNL
jgi:hypothetical protein